MRRLTENLSREDRRFYWKFVGGLYGLYAALMIIAVSVFVGNHLSKNRALEPAVAMGGKPPAAIEAPAPAGMRRNMIDFRRIFFLANEPEMAR